MNSHDTELNYKELKGFFVTMKKAGDTGKPVFRLVRCDLYNPDEHGAIMGAVKQLPPPEHSPEKASVRLMRDGQVRTCPVRNIFSTVTASLVFYGEDKPAFIAGREDFLDVAEILR